MIIGEAGLVGRFNGDVMTIAVWQLEPFGVFSAECLRQGLLDCDWSNDWSEERTRAVSHSC